MTAGEERPARSRRRLIAIALVVGLLGVITLAIAAPLIATSSPDFFARYHLLQRRYVNLEGSAHEGIGCRTCHETQPVANGAQLIADFYVSLFETEPLPQYFTFRPPTRAACLACHATDWSSDASRTAVIPHPAHQRVASEERDCVRCHKWTAHFEAYMPKHKQMPFSGVCVAYGCHAGTKVSSQCFDCHHVLRNDADQWKTVHPSVARKIGENACTESCHKVAQCQECHTTGKTPQFGTMPIETGMQAIEKLHVRPDWTTRFHGTQALVGKRLCMRCHLSQGECGECHLQRPAFHGSVWTWLGRHKKIAHGLSDPRCLECHKKPWCESCHKQFKESG